MPVKLFTGLPGAGKTACLVAEIVRLREESPDRPVFAMGINGLQEGLAIDLKPDQLASWWELPQGSIIAIDECQEDHLMPRDRGNPAAWVQRIAKVRHYGMDFLLTTQHPGNMSSYVRRLVDQHVHAVRKFNTKIVSRYTWGRCMDEPEKRAAQKAAVETVGTLPAAVFDLYKSASMHTMKKRVPGKVYLFGVLAAVAVVAVVSVPLFLKRAQHHNVDVIQGESSRSSSRSSVPDAVQVDRELRAGDYSAWMRPRVAAIPWSAPAFDGQQVRAVPQLFCVAVEDGRCSCLTEQGTRYAVPVLTCRQIATDGLYNPFVASDADRQGRQARPADQHQPQAAGQSAELPTVSGEVRARATARPYVPPEYMPPNA